MSNKSPMAEPPHHFSDYGFDPQFDYFQVLEEVRNQQTEDLTTDIDSFPFNLHKPKKRRWWKKAFTFFTRTTEPKPKPKPFLNYDNEEDRDVHFARARAFRAAACSIYMTETPPQPLFAGRRSDGGGGVTGASGCNSPYLSLRELNMERQQLQRMSGSASPIYLVT